MDAGCHGQSGVSDMEMKNNIPLFLAAGFSCGCLEGLEVDAEKVSGVEHDLPQNRRVPWFSG